MKINTLSKTKSDFLRVFKLKRKNRETINKEFDDLHEQKKNAMIDYIYFLCLVNPSNMAYNSFV